MPHYQVRNKNHYLMAVLGHITLGCLFVCLTVGFTTVQSQPAELGRVLPGLTKCSFAKDTMPISTYEMRKLAIDFRAIPRPGTLDGGSLRGVVKIEISVDRNGKVICIDPVSGHPLALGAAITDIRAWKFRPYLRRGMHIAVRGQLTIPYDFSGKSTRRSNFPETGSGPGRRGREPEEATGNSLCARATR